MKKILLATTMLAGTAGLAAAEVTVKGEAEMGIWSNAAGDVAFWQDVEVKFSMSGTTDGGLEFGAAIDLDEGNVALNDDSGTTVYISGAFGKLTLGDTDGALDWALADMDSGMTSIADDHTTHVAWFGGNDMDGSSNGAGDGQILRYENTFGQFGFAVSLEQGDDGVGVEDDIYGVGIKYTANLGGTDVNLGLAYQDAGDNGSAIGVSAAATFGGAFTGKIGYISFDDDWDNRDNKIGAELTYVSGPIGVGVNYGKVEQVVGDSFDSFGVVANYDLGGGAKVEFGYGSDVDGLDNDQWSLGIGMSF
ncbi:porin [Xinfangfangia pollutisoli]|uniref:porin n=1 Tax=Xinfangfangia pollutisoli TaxID=2865960 RepID=UPI001CD785B3|nr:porin [Xinfangfangia pollutisoli]